MSAEPSSSKQKAMGTPRPATIYLEPEDFWEFLKKDRRADQGWLPDAERASSGAWLSGARS